MEQVMLRGEWEVRASIGKLPIMWMSEGEPKRQEGGRRARGRERGGGRRERERERGREVRYY